MKKMFMFVLTTVLMIALSVTFTGCKAEKNALTGNWVYSEYYFEEGTSVFTGDPNGSYENLDVQLITFKSDGTGKADGTSFNWALENGHDLIISCMWGSGRCNIRLEGNTMYVYKPDFTDYWDPAVLYDPGNEAYHHPNGTTYVEVYRRAD